MARQGSVSFGASRRPLYDAIVGALFVLICAASVYLPILLLPGAIVLCALLRGGRTTYPALLFALGFAAIVLVCGSFLFAILALVFLLFAVLPIALLQKKLAGRAHFDGVLVQCAGVALGIAAVYGVLYLLLGAEPIHTIYHTFLCVTDAPKDSVRLQEGETVAYRWLKPTEFRAFAVSVGMIDHQKARLTPFLRELFPDAGL